MKELEEIIKDLKLVLAAKQKQLSDSEKTLSAHTAGELLNRENDIRVLEDFTKSVTTDQFHGEKTIADFKAQAEIIQSSIGKISG